MTEPLTTQQLDEIRTVTDAATPGPWGSYNGGTYADVAADLTMTSRSSYSYTEKIARLDDEDYWDDPAHEDDAESRAAEQMAANAAFIAAARTAVPALLADNQHLRQQLAAAERIRENADFHLGQEMSRRQLAEKETASLRAALAETRTETLTAEADLIVACCPDHGTRDGVWMTCHCPVADDMRRRAAARPAATTQDGQP